MTKEVVHGSVAASDVEIFPAEIRKFLEGFDIGGLSLQMYASDASADELVSSADGKFGADLLRFPANGKVPMHTHDGAHVLIIIGGTGLLLSEGSEIELHPGVVYFVPENAPHEIRASSALTLISVGNRRVPPSSPERLTVC